LENGVFEVFHFLFGFCVILPHLVDIVLMVNQSVNNGVNELLDQVSRLGLDIKPEQLK